jgi:hypothetical protein
MAVRCKEMTERLKFIEDQEIEAIEAIDGGLEFELAACDQGFGTRSVVRAQVARQYRPSEAYSVAAS